MLPVCDICVFYSVLAVAQAEHARPQNPTMPAPSVIINAPFLFSSPVHRKTVKHTGREWPLPCQTTDTIAAITTALADIRFK